MTAKEIKINSSMSITVELERKVQDRVVNLDGERYASGREVVERTEIVLYKDGKRKDVGDYLHMLDAKFDAAMIEKGAAARFGDTYVSTATANKIVAAIAELDAENPKSAEQLAIESDKAAALRRAEADADLIAESMAFERRMDGPNSDL